MRLPRLHVVTDGAVLARPDFGARLAAVAALGPRVAVHLRDRSADGRTFWRVAERWADVIRDARAMLVVSARPDVAALVRADAVQLGAGDLAVPDARRVALAATMGCSVHSLDGAQAAIEDGADYLIAGTIFPTPSHPGRSGSGPASLVPLVATGRPVLAIGGVTVATAGRVRDAGAWGVAVIRAVWEAADSRSAAEALLAPWETAA